VYIYIKQISQNFAPFCTFTPQLGDGTFLRNELSGRGTKNIFFPSMKKYLEARTISKFFSSLLMDVSSFPGLQIQSPSSQTYYKNLS